MVSSSNVYRVTAACAAMMMMMMAMVMMSAGTAAASPSRHSPKAQKMSSDEAEMRTVHLQLDSKALDLPGSVRPLENAAVSPWTYNVSYDASRFPQLLSEARCLLRGCLDSQGKEDLSLESKPIMHQVLLLRQVKAAGEGSGAGHSYHYRLESRLLAVGCTCVRPTIQ